MIAIATFIMSAYKGSSCIKVWEPLIKQKKCVLSSSILDRISTSRKLTVIRRQSNRDRKVSFQTIKNQIPKEQRGIHSRWCSRYKKRVAFHVKEENTFLEWETKILMTSATPFKVMPNDWLKVLYVYWLIIVRIFILIGCDTVI